MTWQIKQLEDAVRNACGARYGDSIHGPLGAVGWKSDIAYFHACEADQALADAIAAAPEIGESDPTTITYAKAAFLAAMPNEIGQQMRTAQFKAEAHIIASAQALHSLCDIICHVVYWAYRFDTVQAAPSTRRLNLHSTLRTLEKLPAKYAESTARVKAVVESPEFKYLRAYVNTTKHQSLVGSSISASLRGEGRGGMRIQAFSYVDRTGEQFFPRKWAYDFLFTENHALRLKLMAVGISMNEHFS